MKIELIDSEGKPLEVIKVSTPTHFILYRGRLLEHIGRENPVYIERPYLEVS